MIILAVLYSSVVRIERETCLDLKFPTKYTQGIELAHVDILICPLLSGPKSMLFWITKEIGNAIEEAQAGGDHRQVA